MKAKKLVLGNKIPRDFFITKGRGQSDIAIRAGSYHLALKDADIDVCNILTYNSMLPPIATLKDKPEFINPGEVIECIMSVCTGRKGQRATAGIGYGWLYDKVTGERFAGLVCENYGYYEVNDLTDMLTASLDELYNNGYSEDYDLKDAKVITESFVVSRTHGTALVALCFMNYDYPVVAIK